MKKFLLIAVLVSAFAVKGAQTNAVVAIPWKAPLYSLVANSMNIREALETFGSAQGISVVMSKAVSGVFSGTFTNIPAPEFLDRIATSHNLIWYYDGAALYIYGSGEVSTILIDLKYMKAGEVRSLLRELGVEDSRYPIKTASNGELIMVSGPPRYVTLVAETISKADTLRELRTFNEVEARVFPLVNTWADDVSFSVSNPESSVTIRGVARILEEIMSVSSGSKVKESVTNKTEAVESHTSQASSVFTPVIRPDNRLNAVIVRDVVTRFPMYEKLIKELDVPQKLVEIAVTVVELSREDALDWQLSFKVDAAQDEVQGSVGQNARNLFDQASLAGKGLAGAVTYLGEDVNVSASLSALREKGKARSISRTSLLTLNNLAAQMTDTQSYHARVVGTEVASLEEVTAGTRLQIKPRIVKSADTNTPSRVWLTMELQDGGFESVTVDAMPMTRSSTLETQASVLDSHSILLAGYMRDIKESAGWGIPYLRDIPWIGWIFGGASYRDETVQRLFILTPYVIDADEPDYVRVQATRQRDITLEEKVESDKHSDDMERKKRNEQIEEMREIREDNFEEWYYRDSKERKFRKERREDEFKAGRKAWEAEFEERKKKYEDEKKAEKAADAK